MQKCPPLLFRCLGRTVGSIWVRDACEYFVIPVFTMRSCLQLAQLPNLKGHPLSAVRDCLFNIFASTVHNGGRSSILNLRTRHAVVTGTHFSWRRWMHGEYNDPCICCQYGYSPLENFHDVRCLAHSDRMDCMLHMTGMDGYKYRAATEDSDA
jgi:hypothetical protein